MKHFMTGYSNQEKKERWEKLLSLDNDVKRLFMIDYIPNHLQDVSLRLDNKEEIVEAAWVRYNWMKETSEWLKDDRIPYLYIPTGTQLFAEALGCKVYYPNRGNPCSIHLITDARDVKKIRVPNLEDSSLMRIFDMMDRLIAKAGKDVVVRLPDIQSPMDVVAMVWDKTEYLCALIEEKDAVRELAYKAYLIITRFLDEWFRRYGTEYIAHWPDYYIEGGITLSEDEIGIVNCDMFEEFFLDELNKLSDRYGGIGIHCCADAGHQWNGLKKIHNLRLLNLGHRLKYELTEAYSFFSQHCAQMNFGYHTAMEPLALDDLLDTISPDAHAAICGAVTTVKTREEAVKLSEYLREKFNRV